MLKSLLTAVCLSLASTATCADPQMNSSVMIEQSKVDHQNKININTASIEQLTSLIGIGVSKAKAIIDYRKVNGKFNELEELSKVKGIGTKLVEQNKEDMML